MMGLLGRKLGMTQLFQEDGTVLPVTVIETGPCTVTRVKVASTKDGYNALQLGFGSQKVHRLTKAAIGHLRAASLSERPPRYLREIRVSADVASAHTVGQVLTADQVFAVGQRLDVTGVSKGRGFAGVFKRHHFAGFERTHGVHEYFRHGGSIGTRLTPGHVMKGKKMPGHLGAERVTVQNIQVVRIDSERNLVFLKGGVPGPTGALVLLRKAVKRLPVKRAPNKA